mmetsp:Transcript_5482/g.12091  ORF Transcript_5482/g.12091 Transcript_5482/m.12091 type:complete len:239 (+) Transcript_5482:1584-2300(+)
MFFATSGSIFSSSIWITMPLSSLPRRPALPLICMYSPEVIQRKSCPSNFLVCVKTTVLAGMLMPMEKVSVAKRHLMRPSWKRISITSFRMGSRPPWWMPTPFFSRGRMVCTAGSALSSSESESMAFTNTLSTSAFSSSLLNSSRAICSAYASQSFLLKLNMMQGSSCRSMISLMIFTRSEFMLLVCFLGFPPFPSPPSDPGWGAPDCSRLMARWKLSSRNFPFSSTTRCSPSVPAGKT